MMQSLVNRHPGTQQIAEWFSFDHLINRSGYEASRMCHNLAAEIIDHLPDSPELTAGLRKLLEAKDCFVRAALAAAKEDRSDG
jgi:hypothetical protein